MRTTREAWLNLAFSPKGNRLAFERMDDIWMYDWLRDAAERLTSDPAADTNPTWTPDGARIAFASTRGNAPAPMCYNRGRRAHEQPGRGIAAAVTALRAEPGRQRLLRPRLFVELELSEDCVTPTPELERSTGRCLTIIAIECSTFSPRVFSICRRICN